MHIKKIVIEGFKSYGGHTVIGPLNPGHNVVVGSNGSGKSNFFAAVQFVLSDEFSLLQIQQRHALLHEGTGPRSMTASVEIIFDNSDRRLPVDKNEVSLKRVIGTKKDQFIINKNITARSEVESFLEAAGFSKSNPYYIIQQGKVNEIAMTPESRLMLLMEIAGVQVYEDRRKEALKILHETQFKMTKIDDLLQTINEKLNTLYDEAEELKEYQKWDRERRTIEYVFYNHELAKSNEKMIKLQAKYENLKQEQAELQQKIKDFSNQIKNINHDLKRAQRDADRAEEEQDNLSKELDKLVVKKESYSIKVSDLKEDIKLSEENQKFINEKISSVNQEIENTQRRLEEVTPEYEAEVDRGKDIIRQLKILEQEQQIIFAKQGRSAQFRTREDRDYWITQELTLIANQIEEKINHINNLENSISEIDQKLKDFRGLQEHCLDEMKHHHGSAQKFHKEYIDLSKERDNLSARKKDLCRREKALLDDMAYLEEDKRKINQDLTSMFGKAIFNGINSVNKVLNIFRERDNLNDLVDDEYYGLVVDCFSCHPGFYRAVEVHANNRLFFHIVKTSDFAQKILKEMNEQHLPGTANFIPIDRLQCPRISYPKFDENLAKPLMLFLEIRDNCNEPISYIFGKVIITRDLKTVTRIANSSGFDCITVDGDQASSKGWLRGGHFSQSKSPMKIQEDKTNLQHELDSKKIELVQLNEKIQEIDNQITSVVSKLQQVETKKTKTREIYDKLTYDLNNVKEQIEITENNQILQRKSLEELKSDLYNLRTLKKKFDDELQEDLNDQLTSADKQQIDNLNKSMAELRKKLKNILKKREHLEKDKNQLENLLRGHLNCKKNELERELITIGLEDKKLSLEKLEHNKEFVEKEIEKCRKDLEVMKTNYKNIIAQKKLRLEELDSLYDNLKPEEQKFQEKSKKIQMLSSDMRIHEDNVINTKKKIAEFGIVRNADLYRKYEKTAAEKLYKKLEKCRKNLKNYEHINKKALEQYETFRDQKGNLFKRKEELDRASVKIEDLLNVLQQKKYEAVEFTFKQVSKYFSEIFSKLVPRGSAELVMRSQRSSQSQTDSSSTTSVDYDNISGIRIRVSFSSQMSAMEEYCQLSGGEKSLVALALIFAIQKCDPAPFYLLDEIDRDLDTSHREAVAAMIHELSSEAQFVTITHRPELLRPESQHYGVAFQNKLSVIYDMTYEDALKYVENYADDADDAE